MNADGFPRQKMQPVNKLFSALKSGFVALSPTCRDAARLQSQAIDAKLCLSKRMGLGLHLLICKWCRRYGKQIHFIHEAASGHPESLTEAVPQKLSPEARERIKKRLQPGT